MGGLKDDLVHFSRNFPDGYFEYRSHGGLKGAPALQFCISRMKVARDASDTNVRIEYT